MLVVLKKNRGPARTTTGRRKWGPGGGAIDHVTSSADFTARINRQRKSLQTGLKQGPINRLAGNDWDFNGFLPIGKLLPASQFREFPCQSNRQHLIARWRDSAVDDTVQDRLAAMFDWLIDLPLRYDD